MVTTVGSRVFMDTNILIYAQSALALEHAMALAVLQNLASSGAEVWISRQRVREDLAGMTRPSSFTGMAPIASLIADVRRFEANFHLAEDGPAITAELLQLLGTITSLGKQIHDANIVATMLAHGVPNLLTHNVNDFVRFAGVINVLPLVPPITPAPSASPVPPPPPGAP
jgi:predicted nucleic acid-binding protein